MWSPTHIQLTVNRAKDLLIKGKHGTNNCFVIIALGKEKYQTSVKEKVPDAVEWHEECELQIPTQGNRAELVLTALHHNSLGLDDFLGQVVLPLNEMDVYERPRSRWYKLQSKPGKEKKKERGELEVRIAFTVKAGSLTDLSKKEKNKSSISNLASSVGGSLLSIGAIEKRKGLKKIAKSLGSKMHISGIGRKGGKEKDAPAEEVGSFNGSFSSIGTPSGLQSRQSKQTIGDADPGVISEDDDEFVFDNLSHKSSGSSLNIRANVTGTGKIAAHSQASNSSTPDETRKLKSTSLPPSKPPRTIAEHGHEPEKVDEWEQKLYGKHLDIGSSDSLKRRSWESSRVLLSVQQEDHEKEAEESERKPAVIQETSSVTAPTSPVLAEKEHSKPKPLPRVSSQDISRMNEKLVSEAVISNALNKSEAPKPEKESFTKKLKHFIKDHHRAESLENLATAHKKTNGTKLSVQQQMFSNERIIIGGENGELLQRQAKVTQISPEILNKYEGKSREEMMKIAHNLENEVHYQKQKVKELEDYLDSLLLKVMECHPKILQNPYQKANPTKR